MLKLISSEPLAIYKGSELALSIKQISRHERYEGLLILQFVLRLQSLNHHWHLNQSNISTQKDHY
ncbi:hypothetical protein PAXRUDRAFT_319524 [Paxillus rubicundulus Ve08.2h10]|uniref:Uncharacterized protein n=1 Tax=Paxillus rubicundulus Ve08.2h10 TaxID=930991 RepID=A0A0D0CT56_9AGAM|nr:hypothetical protein PAXRUDRAFT_319524 [Paxillus rubicundulus Ve08.2h10]